MNYEQYKALKPADRIQSALSYPYTVCNRNDDRLTLVSVIEIFNGEDWSIASAPKDMPPPTLIDELGVASYEARSEDDFRRRAEDILRRWRINPYWTMPPKPPPKP